ncbi:MAG: TatD family hydrolase [Planctomycetota bacterium]
MIDSHCHLSFPDYNSDLDAVLQRAAEVGVTDFITVGTGPEDWKRCLDLAAGRPAVRVALGLHPNEAGIFTPALAEQLMRLAEREARVVAIGETGLDWYRKQCPREKQLESLRTHLRLAAALRKPFILHCREAEREMFDELAAFQSQSGARLRGVWHCFTSTAVVPRTAGAPAGGGAGAAMQAAERAVELGLYFGLNGVVTYPKTEALRAVVAKLPGDRLLLETDCPFLPPQGWRGQRNEPAYLTKVAAVVAEIRKMCPEELCRVTAENTRALFGL